MADREHLETIRDGSNGASAHASAAGRPGAAEAVLQALDGGDSRRARAGSAALAAASAQRRFSRAFQPGLVVASRALMFATGNRGLGLSVIATAVLAMGVAGCPPHEYVMVQTGVFPKPFVYHDTIEMSRKASAQINTLHDFETARGVAYGGIGQLEGLHYLVKDDADDLYLLTSAWTGIAFGFIDDDREVALEAKDEVLAEYHAQRARAACKRARYFGEELLRQHAEGFEAAQRNVDTLRAWLVKNVDDRDRADELFWLGFSIVGTVTFDRANPAAVAELWVGVEILEHVLRLDETVERGMAHTVLGAYHARSAMAELGEAKKHLDRALALQQGKLLTTQVTLAQTYYCMKGDRQGYYAALQSVLDAKDPLPEARLQNVIAKRKARRYLGNRIWQEECGFK